jgi:hypothetical protein
VTRYPGALTGRSCPAAMPFLPFHRATVSISWNSPNIWNTQELLVYPIDNASWLPYSAYIPNERQTKRGKKRQTRQDRRIRRTRIPSLSGNGTQRIWRNSPYQRGRLPPEQHSIQRTGCDITLADRVPRNANRRARIRNEVLDGGEEPGRSAYRR